MTNHPDTPRLGATDDDSVAALYTLTITDVVQRYADAGLPKNPRTVQRYAAAGKIKAQKIMTATGELYLINAESVDLHLTELQQLERQARLVASGRDLSRQGGHDTQLPFAATYNDMGVRQGAAHRDLSSTVAQATQRNPNPHSDDTPRHTPPTGDDIAGQKSPSDPDTSRPVATPPLPIAPVEDRYVKQLERENDFLRDQVGKKDSQIEALTKLSEGTLTNVTQQNTLLQGFQRLLGLGQKSESRGDTRDPA
jgi:hypothetical protein